MATKTVKLNSGFDMPLIGLGTWQVCDFLLFKGKGWEKLLLTQAVCSGTVLVFYCAFCFTHSTLISWP